MSREGGGKRDKVSVVAKVLVAVKAAKEIPKTALIWALTHVVQPGDCITLLVFASSQTSGKDFLHNCSSSCNNSHIRFISLPLEVLNSSHIGLCCEDKALLLVSD